MKLNYDLNNLNNDSYMEHKQNLGVFKFLT